MPLVKTPSLSKTKASILASLCLKWGEGEVSMMRENGLGKMVVEEGQLWLDFRRLKQFRLCG